MHFCHEELFAIMAMIPGLTMLVNRARVWWHARHRCRHEKKAVAVTRDLNLN